jgi:hypothetical protein
MSGGAKAGLIIGGVIGAFALLIVAITVLGEESTTGSSSTGSAIDGGTDAADDDGPDGTFPDTIAVPSGFALIEGDGVSIAAPDTWTRLDASDVDMSPEDFAAAFPDAPPEMAEQGDNMFAQGAVLVGFDFTNAAFASNVSVIDIPGEAPLDVAEDQARQQIELLGGEVLESGTVELPPGEAARLEYTLDVALPDGSSAPAGGVQLYLPFDGRTYIVTITSDTNVAELADEMLETFRVG